MPLREKSDFGPLRAASETSDLPSCGESAFDPSPPHSFSGCPSFLGLFCPCALSPLRGAIVLVSCSTGAHSAHTHCQEAGMAPTLRAVGEELASPLSLLWSGTNPSKKNSQTTLRDSTETHPLLDFVSNHTTVCLPSPKSRQPSLKEHSL